MLLALFLAALPLVQDPSPAPDAPEAPAVSALELCGEFARALHAAPVVHCVADGLLIAPEPAAAGGVRRWRLEADVWMQKGGRCRASVRWAEVEEPPEAGAAPVPQASAGSPASPLRVHRLAADGKRVYSWFEGDEEYASEPLARTQFVPFPLPEVFAAFEDGGWVERRRDPPRGLPALTDASGFVWDESLGPLPTVAIAEEGAQRSGPVTWISFRPSSGLPAGCCVLYPPEAPRESVEGNAPPAPEEPAAPEGDALTLRFRALEFVEEWPKDLPPPAAPEGLREAPAPPPDR